MIFSIKKGNVLCQHHPMFPAFSTASKECLLWACLVTISKTLAYHWVWSWHLWLLDCWLVLGSQTNQSLRRWDHEVSWEDGHSINLLEDLLKQFPGDRVVGWTPKVLCNSPTEDSSVAPHSTWCSSQKEIMPFFCFYVFYIFLCCFMPHSAILKEF